MEALQNPLPKSFHVGAPYQNQIQEMQEQNKTAAFLLIVLMVIAGAVIIVQTGSERSTWQTEADRK